MSRAPESGSGRTFWGFFPPSFAFIPQCQAYCYLFLMLTPYSHLSYPFLHSFIFASSNVLSLMDWVTRLICIKNKSKCVVSKWWLCNICLDSSNTFSDIFLQLRLQGKWLMEERRWIFLQSKICKSYIISWNQILMTYVNKFISKFI